jgi:hypothetical protein
MGARIEVGLRLGQQGVQLARGEIIRNLVIPSQSIKLGEPLTELGQPAGWELVPPG